MRKYNGKVIDINATAAKLGEKCFDLLAVHALSGCDTVSYPFGKGKTSAVNLMLNMNLNLQVFASPEATELEWMKAWMDFLSLLYCRKTVESLSNLRFVLFSRKTPQRSRLYHPLMKPQHSISNVLVFKYSAGEQLTTVTPLQLTSTSLGGKLRGAFPFPYMVVQRLLQRLYYSL